MNKKILDDLQAKLGQIMANSPAKDIERNIRAVLTQGLSRLDLVTKEEFEVQRLTIVQMQNKIFSLETRLTELEHQMRHQKELSSKTEAEK